MLGSTAANLFTFGLLIVLLISGAVLIWWARVRFRGNEENLDGFTLQELRTLHADGKLSKTEYHAARKVVLGNTVNLGKPDQLNESNKTLSGKPRTPGLPDKSLGNSGGEG